jgi:hypothetical protein
MFLVLILSIRSLLRPAVIPAIKLHTGNPETYRVPPRLERKPESTV